MADMTRSCWKNIYCLCISGYERGISGKKSVDIYIVKNSYSADHSVSIDIKGGDTGLFDEDENEDLTYEVSSSNSKMYVSARVSQGKLILHAVTPERLLSRSACMTKNFRYN